MNKQAILDSIRAALMAELENFTRSAKSAHREATDEQNKAENKYDTRGLEASYLARGQSRQALETAQALEQYRALTPRNFDRVDLGALVTVERAGERTVFYLGPGAGGTEVTCEGETVVVITPQSPIGRSLMGLNAGGKVPQGKVTAVE